MLPHPSMASHVRVATKEWPEIPLVSVLTTITVTLVPSQTSKADGRVKLQGKPHSTKRSRAQVSTGGAVSRTVIVWLQVAMFVQESKACHVRVALKLLPQKPSVFVTVLMTAMVRLVPSQASL